MSKIIEKYQSALDSIYEHVGFKEDWAIFPLDPQMEMFWKMDDDKVYYAESEHELETESGKYYESTIVKQRFYKKWVYEGAEFTLIFTTQHVDGMSYFTLFNNKNRIL